ncbi:hypothetical protein [Halomonas korlensis]|uniref:Uncharacterized protein n=1 Tax=Halomonas korlensis TaxID=463301 RepID=A0A1I7G0T9_9GAMM|nr:hypothetical protein [Halomonas korlensis]SFU42068.1 hypothetical protein SAMN04487955_102159 [Halomonas korlensis]
MPLQNRVDPWGRILESPARGTLMGNRGILHDDDRQVKKTHAHQNWVVCVLQFKGNRRSLMAPGRYTELFFPDEATALAAGHRPCMECQRERGLEFKKYWTQANRPDGTGGVRVPEMDRQLHRERISRREKVTWLSPVAALPDGAFFEHEGQAYLVWGGGYWRWSFEGYQKADPLVTNQAVEVLAPHSVVQALKHGFVPKVKMASESSNQPSA